MIFKSLPLCATLGFFLCTGTLDAQERVFESYITYSPKDLATSVTVDSVQLKYLAEVAGLLGPEGFTFLQRRDSSHWVGVSRDGINWVLHIHDETAKYNFRALVDRKKGRLTVQRGVTYKGLGREASAEYAAKLALTYLDRVRLAKDVFGPPRTAPSAMSPISKMTPPTKKVSSMNGDSNLKTAKPKAPSMESSSMTKSAQKSDPMATPMPVEPMMPAVASMTPAAAPKVPTIVSSNDMSAPWDRLMAGNARFAAGKAAHPHQDVARLNETALKQMPFAIVVTSSDSRVPPELIFDQGLGDLIVVRTAGQVVTEVELGTIEKAVTDLKVPFLVVLGHKRSDAVDATIKGGEMPPNQEAVAAQIRPAVESARFYTGDLLENAVKENAKSVLKKIGGSKIVAQALRDGQLKLQAAYYDLDTGKVSPLD